MKKIYCFDLDGTLCSTVVNSDYTKAEPILKAIKKVNELYDHGNEIIIFTGRGSSSGIDWSDFTSKQLQQWNLKFHKLITGKKPTYDIVIDDKAINAAEWRNVNCGTFGVLAGSFDLIHPGYCSMFKTTKEHCDHLTVLLHDDPSLENNKIKLIHNINERKQILNSIKYIDDIIVYKTENELENILCSGKYDKRFLGDDYRDKKITGKTCLLEIIYIDRSHGYSTTKLKNQILNR